MGKDVELLGAQAASNTKTKTILASRHDNPLYIANYRGLVLFSSVENVLIILQGFLGKATIHGLKNNTIAPCVLLLNRVEILHYFCVQDFQCLI